MRQCSTSAPAQVRLAASQVRSTCTCSTPGPPTLSGYLLACFAHLCPHGEIRGIEVVPELVRLGNANLRRQPLPETARVKFELGDGWRGLSEHRFDAIHVGAAAERVPEALVSQLKSPGRMVVPVGPDGGAQELLQVDKAADGTVSYTTAMDVRFVPLVQKPGEEYDASYIQ
jgi:protein-L-isoaspartate(D-aspartate) O-methyltransferase